MALGIRPDLISIQWKPWNELAPSFALRHDEALNVRKPSYGRYLEDFEPGEVFLHPRGITLEASFAQEFAATFMESNPLFLNEIYPRTLGFDGQLVSPLMVLATTLSLGVQNESEKAIAHLGYYNVCFPQPTRVGDSLRALTKVLSRKERGPGEPGIVHVQTLGVNQRDQICVRYERKILIPPKPPGLKLTPMAAREKIQFAWPENPQISIPAEAAKVIPGWTAGATFYEDFNTGDIVVHANGRTITDEHVPWTYRLGNTHPLHYDSVYSHAQASPMGGNPVVYGGLVFSWIAGLASRDMTENMIWDMGYTEGYHTQPARSGDTLYAVSRVLAKEEGPAPGTGLITAQLIGLRNVRADEAIAKHSHALFIKENDKKKMGLEKIPEKIFEIERRILIRKRP